MGNQCSACSGATEEGEISLKATRTVSILTLNQTLSHSQNRKVIPQITGLQSFNQEAKMSKLLDSTRISRIMQEMRNILLRSSHISEGSKQGNK